MNQSKIDLQLLWDAANGGLNYIHEVYPQSVGCEDKKSKKFKIRATEKTASTSLWRGDDNIYRIKDHGGEKAQNAIDLCMQEENLSFIEAVKFLFAKYSLAIDTPDILKPDVSFKETDLPQDYYNVNWSEKTANLAVFAPFCTPEIANHYNLFSIDSYEKVTKTGKLKTVTATERYPIFGYKENGFVKIYEPNCPKNDEFLLKHHFLGTKPQRHIYGWKQLFDNINLDEIIRVKKQLREATRKGDYTRGLEQELDELQIKSVTIATGGSDGLNIASLGETVIWFNSESERISADEQYRLSLAAKVVHNLPDLDKTGVTQAVLVGMHFVDIKTIWLPEQINNSPIKDVRDWVTRHKNLPFEAVQKLYAKVVSNALEFKFWQYNDRGRYALDNKIMLYFLKHSGFYLYKVIMTSADATKEIEETRIVFIDKNIVKVVSPRQVKNYVLKWLDDRFIDRAVYNMILKSVYFSDNALLMLPEITLDTASATKDSQLYYFNNAVAKVTASGIEKLKYSEVNNLVWQSNVLNHDLKPQSSFFAVSKDESQNYKLEILNYESNFFKVLIQTSRMFWKKDIDAQGNDTNKFGITSKNLTDEENAEQLLHLLNKMYVVGYLLHKYKQKSRPWFVLGIDKKIGASIKDSNGGSGKSFLVDSCQAFLRNIKFKDGKEMPKEDPKFMFDGVTSETDLVFMDDMVHHQDYNVVFSKTSGTFVANHKGGKIYTIPYEQSPKIAGTTNFVPSDLNASLMRRLLEYQCSDYYHQAGNDYTETRKISSDFNDRDLFDSEYSKTEWQSDINFMLQCIQLYLSQPDMIKAPSGNLVIRNLQQKVGDVMLKHCNEWFSEKDENGDFLYLDKWFPRKELQEAYIEEAGKFAKTATAHKDSMEFYCEMHGWKFEYQKKAIPNPQTGKRNSVEHYFINTKGIDPVKLEPEPTQHFVDFDEEVVNPNDF